MSKNVEGERSRRGKKKKTKGKTTTQSMTPHQRSKASIRHASGVENRIIEQIGKEHD
jgi:hypothetical protein